MIRYYVNKNSYYEVHRADCSWLPKPKNRICLGRFGNCKPAVRKARRDYYNGANGCFFCSRACHTT